MPPRIMIRKIGVPNTQTPEQWRTPQPAHQDDLEARSVEPREVATKMKLDYAHGVKDHNTRVIDELTVFCARLRKPNIDTDALLTETADMISRVFGISSVAISLWDPGMRVFRFRATTGLGQDGVALYKSLTFTKEQMVSDKNYPSYEISKQTRLYLSEDHPYVDGEESSFQRPGMIGMKRRSLTDSLEADYLCVFIHGPNDEVTGWIEVSGTRLRKLPEIAAIKWIELIASLLGVVLRTKW